MKISYNWLKQYINTNLGVDEIADILTSIGLEVESVDKIESIKGGLKGVVIGEVMECEKHPDADRLRVTRVNVGSPELLQIVCGAPNVAAGQKVLVATIGTTLYPAEGEPLTIKKGKIRGQESAGMICAEDELGIGKSHDGILVLDSNAEVGMPAAMHLGITEDYCLEIGLTPNRTDAISHFGVARDLYAAIRNMQGLNKDRNASLTFPEIHEITTSSDRSVSVEVMDSAACPRYCGVLITDIKVEPSPQWLQDRLKTIGLKPINNIVDITNFVQHEMGQPLHAFDAAMIEGSKVIVRKASEGETFVSLDGIQRKLSAEDLMICDTSKPMCIAGVFGGLNSGVTDKTNSVFLESAYFNAAGVRKTARRHGLNTDASFRFERGCDPSMTLIALKRAVGLIHEIADGKVSGQVADHYPQKVEPKVISFSKSAADRLIGKPIEEKNYLDILNDLDIEVNKTDADLWQLTIPLYRTDVTREADVIEEILRIYGYDNIDTPSKLLAALSYVKGIDEEKTQNSISDYLMSAGFNEMMSLSLTKKRYTELVNSDQYNMTSAVELLNPLSNDLAVMRQTLLYSGLEAIVYNQNHRNTDLRLFEFGKEYRKIAGKYSEEKHLVLFMTGNRYEENWERKSEPVSFFDLKAIVNSILQLLRIQGAQVTQADSEFFEDSLQYSIGKNKIAQIGEVKQRLLAEFDIKQSVQFVDIKWDTLFALIPQKRQSYSAPEKFPSVRRDLSLLLDKSVAFESIEQCARKTERKLLREIGLFDVYEGKNLAEGKKSYAVSFILQDSTKTMTDKQVETVMARILQSLQQELGAELRS